MNTNDMPQAHAELLDALHRQDEQARQMKLSERFTERVMEKVKSDELPRCNEVRSEGVKSEGVKSDNNKLPSSLEGNPYYSLFTRSSFTFRKAAAIFLAAAFLCGLAWAIGGALLTSPKGEEPQSAEVTTLPLEGERGGGLVRFADVRLDSILTVVSAHYGKQVCFRDSAAMDMKFITTWNPQDALAAFINHLNMFEGLQLTLSDDTIFVESTIDEDAQ